MLNRAAGLTDAGLYLRGAETMVASWEEYARWHLGLTDGANDETKTRYAFIYGDLRRLHRTGLIACVYRASEWRHKDIELAAHDLLQLLDKATGLAP